jgi:exopolyphosphatase/guanosine-5'-triphosphate,3'-diphosphate pyrophosphatase
VSNEDDRRLTELLGHEPRRPYEVVVRRRSGDPVVIRNAPFFDDRTPMPTRWWLVDPVLTKAVSRLESSGGVAAAASAVGEQSILAAHTRYASERDALLAEDHAGPRPRGGVGGTRLGVKCLHAHLAWHLAGGDDPVGRWTEEKLWCRPELGGRAALTDLAGNTGPRAQGASFNRSDGRLAAIDCGTNSTRLLVTDPEGRALARLMRITRLGRGIDASGRLEAEGVRRTVVVLEEYRAVMARLGVTAGRAIATSAARDAANASQFLDAAEQACGLRPELLSGEEEGRLAFVGATADLDPAARGSYLVLDLGGGSTELIFGPPPGGRATGPIVVSLDMGSVRVTERFFHHDPPQAEELAEARDAVQLLLDERLHSSARPPAARLIGLAGTVSTLAAMDLGLKHYDRDRIHHYVLTLQAVGRLLTQMGAEDRASRVQRRGLEAGRADVIVGGALLLATVMERLGFDSCLVSESDILDGVIAALRRAA